MAKTFEDELAALREKHLQPLKDREKQLQSELVEVQRQISLIEGETTTPKKKSSSRKSTSSKPQPTDSDVLDTVSAIAEQNPQIEKSALLDMTKDKLKDQGFELRGFTAKRFDKFLSDDRFAVEGDKVTLQTANA